MGVHMHAVRVVARYAVQIDSSAACTTGMHLCSFFLGSASVLPRHQALSSCRDTRACPQEGAAASIKLVDNPLGQGQCAHAHEICRQAIQYRVDEYYPLRG